MHAHFFMRGDKDSCDLIVRWLQTRSFSFKYKTKDGKEGVAQINGRMNYSIGGSWEYIFPEEHKDVVLATLGFHFTEPIYQGGGRPFQAFLRLLAKTMGLKKVPKFDTKMMFPLPEDARRNVQIHPIGVKYDDLNWQAPNGLIHEAL